MSPFMSVHLCTPGCCGAVTASVQPRNVHRALKVEIRHVKKVALPKPKSKVSDGDGGEGEQTNERADADA